MTSNLTPHGQALYSQLTGRQQAGIIDAHVPADVAQLVGEPTDDAPGLADRVSNLEHVVGQHVANHVPPPEPQEEP